MSPEMKKFIDLLESELGYSEKAGAYTKFGDWYGKNVEFDADYSSAPWCDMYLSWAAHKLGYEEWVGQFAWTVAHAEWFQEQDAWGDTPKPGALVFYDWSGSDDVDNIDHVGIVTRVEGDTIHTIEGNIDGGVAKRKERDTSKVVGYGYPEKIKARLEKEQSQLKEVTASTAQEADPGLRALIPQEDFHAPLSAEPEPAPSPQAANSPKTAKQPKREATPKPTQAAAQPTQAPKKAKHAKPATADTSATTTAPLPVVVDASASTPMPALNSPALVGSTLIAALAVLAIAKTRQLRVRPATASAPARRHKGTRRAPRRSRAPEPVSPAFDFFAPVSPPRPDAYMGRRRGREAPQPRPHSPENRTHDQQPRGRRHRVEAGLEPFTQDAPLRGRRHREPAPAATAPAHPASPSHPVAPAHPVTRRSGGRGRHRA
ncbi:CHAP domain-containing protein [Nonomuraea sp. NBC_01738]|uniref:CHAP domain-containing protein n=1 Tax=Nonomuraea sp. NBC_01738 TaxID=2976003 RepID=UPI002E10B76A|nr:CHAP domain-containing protein [Nonomuraea sp. NBC_01738]